MSVINPLDMAAAEGGGAGIGSAVSPPCWANLHSKRIMLWCLIL